jgi:formylmethanofuran dehydrogenase subunit E
VTVIKFNNKFGFDILEELEKKEYEEEIRKDERKKLRDIYEGYQCDYCDKELFNHRCYVLNNSLICEECYS